MAQALNISETGRLAYLAGLKASANPFRIGSQARSLWSKGWHKARDVDPKTTKASRPKYGRPRQSASA